MSRLNAPAEPVESATTLHAQAVAVLLQTRHEAASRSSSLRSEELRRQPQSGGKQFDVGSAVPTCRRCGVFIVPGWTGSMELTRRKPGRRTGRQACEGQQDSTKPSRANKQEWKCQCGWIQDIASSDQNKTRTFKKRRLQDPIQTVATAAPVRPSLSIAPREQDVQVDSNASAAISSPATVATAPLKHHPSIPPSLPSKTAADSSKVGPSKSHRADVTKAEQSWTTATHGGTSTFMHTTQAPPALKRPPSMTPLDKAPTNKRKKSKKEGLQALLQARKETEAKASQKPAGSGLGLSSFLQSL